MAVTRLIMWIAVAAAVTAAYFFVSGFVLKKKSSPGFVVIVSLAEALIATAIAYLAIAVSNIISWRFNILLIALYAVLLPASVSGIICVLISLFARKSGGGTQVNTRVKRWLCVVLTVAFVAAGTVNMSHICAETTVYQSDKIQSGHYFVFVSDLHVGAVQNKQTIERMLEDIVLLQPQFIVLGGDITDEYSTKEDMEWIYGKFGETGIPTYFVYGNHDRQCLADMARGRTYTDGELTSAIEGNGIVILQDQVVDFADDLCFLGREDSSTGVRLPVSELRPMDGSAYQIIFEHQPYCYDDTQAVSPDLQVSGHSHAGQYFPLEQVYELAGYDSYGDYQLEDTILHVSSGAAGWFVPFRTARHCNFDVIALLPEELPAE